MTIQYDVNNTAITGINAVYKLKTTLVAAGWTVEGSSDGATFSNAAVDKWTSAGALGSGSWVRLRMPTANAVTREILIQRNASSNTSWRIGYSYAGLFTGILNGAISATVAPTATDAVSLLGGGFVSGGATYATFLPADSTYNWSCRADDAAPYGFYGVCLDTVSGTGIIMDPLVAGSYTTGDNDPYVFAVNGSTALLSVSTVGQEAGTLGTNPFSWYKKGLGGEGFVGTGLWSWNNSNSNALTTNGGVDPTDGGDVLLPCWWGRATVNAAPNGPKGSSTLLRWRTVTRNNKDTVSIATGTSREWVYVGQCALPWDGSVPGLWRTTPVMTSRPLASKTPHRALPVMRPRLHVSTPRRALPRTSTRPSRPQSRPRCTR